MPKTNRLLRRLTIRLELGLDVPPDLAAALGTIVGATFTLDFAVGRPNAELGISGTPAAIPSRVTSAAH